MKVETRQCVEARIQEIDEWLRNFEACEMTEGWLSCGPDMTEAAQLYREREQLLEEMAKAA